MAIRETCPDCGSALPPGAPEQLCPKCLLRSGLSEPEQPFYASTAVEERPAEAIEKGVADRREETQRGKGRFKLLEKIGEGGCGVVYVAEQTEPVRRRVALKVIKLGMDTRQVVARFEAERQALAMMDHPNIARVLDAGTTGPTVVDGSSDLSLKSHIAEGRPFFVMELVRGIRITDYCDQASLSTESRIELFIKVCQAIQHAHQKGIIHRDIKPSNILVTLHDGVPVPKVIDFGIAKATEGRLTDSTLYTQLHQFMGTPAYMSPEQAEMSGLDIDTRSDIYSLGVLLYELLAGTTPFDPQELLSQGIDSMRKTIREKEPVRPSRRLTTLNGDDLTTTAKRRSVNKSVLLHQLRGDLDWIVMKCLEKDRTRRYETANSLAADLRRHLSVEPVSAGPPSARYRMEKFVRRNRGPVIAGTLLIMVLLLGMLGTIWGLMKARRQEQEVRKRLEQIERANDILGSIFEQLDPNEIARSERPLQAILVEKLDRALEQLQGESVGDPLVVAATQSKLGRSLIGLGEPGKANGLFEKSRATYESRLGADHPLTLASMHYLAGTYLDLGKRDLATSLFEKTLKMQREKLGPSHPDTLGTLRSLGVAYWQAKQLDKSIPLFEEMLRLQEAAFGRGHHNYALTQADLAQNYFDAGRTAEAFPLYDESIKALRIKAGPTHPQTLQVTGNLAGAYLKVGKPDVAVPLFEAVLKLNKETLGPTHPFTLLAMGNLASAYQESGKLDLAASLSAETLKLRTQKLGSDHPQTLTAMNNLATSYWYLKDFEKAIALYEETVKQQEAKLGPDFPETLLGMHSLARSYQSAGKLDRAEPLLQETLRRMRAKLGPDDPRTLMALGTLAGVYENAGNHERSVSVLHELLQLTEARFGKEDTNTLHALDNLAHAYRTAGKLELAVPVMDEALRLKRIKLGPDHPETLMLMSKLGPAYWRLQQLDRSIPLLEELLRRTEATRGRTNFDTLVTAANLGVNYRDAGRLKEALPLLEEAFRARRTFPQLRWVAPQLVEACTRAGETDQSVSYLKEMIEEVRGLGRPDNLELAGLLSETGQILFGQKKFTEAEPMIRECLAIRAKVEPDGWGTSSTRSLLGGVLLGRKKYAEAEPLLLEGYRGLSLQEANVPPQFRSRIHDSLERLSQLYRETGNRPLMESYQSKLERFGASKQIVPTGESK